MSILPEGLFGGGDEKGQAMYAVTALGKTSIDNGDLNGSETQIMMALDNLTQATAGRIAKDAALERSKVTALLGSLKNRKLVQKVN